MSLGDTPNHEKARRMGGAERNPSSLFIADIKATFIFRIKITVILQDL